jgi:hypothetical protein
VPCDEQVEDQPETTALKDVDEAAALTDFVN